MKIAVPLIENTGKQSAISEHFGHAPFFGFAETGENGEVTYQIIENPLTNHAPGEVPEYLKSKGTEVLLCRGIGGRAIQIFNRMNIEVIRGNSGTIEQLVDEYLQGQLQDTNYQVSEKHSGHH